MDQRKSQFCFQKINLALNAAKRTKKYSQDTGYLDTSGLKPYKIILAEQLSVKGKTVGENDPIESCSRILYAFDYIETKEPI